MFVLYQRGAIENEFLCYIRDCICTLNILEHIRDILFRNFNKLSADVVLIHMYSSTNQYYLIINDSDEDTYVDGLSNIDTNESDTYEDLENRLLDDIAMENDVAAFHATEEHQEQQSYDNNHQDNPFN